MMSSATDSLKKFIGIKEQRLLLFIGLYIVVGLIIHAYIFEISLLFTVIILAWVGQEYISEYAKETVDPVGKYVFITGCDSGFGLASAKAIRDHGFRVIAGCYDENSAGAQELQARSWVDKVDIVSLDVASEISVEAAAKEVREICQDQGLWALINNAGLNSVGPTELVSMIQYHRVAEVNLFGPIRVTKACLPLLRQSKGRIVNVTSERAFNPWKYSTPYCITKFGLKGYSACLKREMADFGVKVVTVAPGHFAGATAIVEGKLVDTLRDSLLHQRSLLSLEDQTNAYSKESVDELCDWSEAERNAHYTNTSATLVVDAYIDAISNINPKPCYYVSGNGRFGVDPLIIIARLRPFIPLGVVEYVEKLLFLVFY